MLIDPILASTPSATSSLLAVQLNQMQQEVMMTNFNMHSPDLACDGFSSWCIILSKALAGALRSLVGMKVLGRNYET